MNLFDIDESYCSHPNYAYKKHIENIADSFDDISHKESASFHDLGKLCNKFQSYIKGESTTKTIHALQGALIYLKQQGYKLNKKTLPVFISILKHHGNLENVNAIANALNYSEDLLNKYSTLLDDIEEIKKIIDDKNTEIEDICDYFDEDDFVLEYNLGGINSYFKIKETFSKLIFSDKNEAIFKNKYTEQKFENIDLYIDKLIKLLSTKNNTLSKVRNSARNDTLETLKRNMNKSIFLIEAPTGIGKTFMALNLALEIVKNKNKKRIINALPMTSIIDQTFDEYSKIFDSNILMKYHHLTFAKKRIENEGEVFYKQKDAFITKSWSDDNVIITTFNQLLNLFYSNRNRDLIKFWTLRDSVIILDEIQAIPRILLKDFSETINFLSKKFNIDFILMSATVPDIKNFLDKKFLCELLDNKYFSLEFNNRYALSFNKNIDSEDKLVSEILEKYNNSNSVLAVVNTKKLALAIYNELKKQVKNDSLFLLSSAFIPIARKNIIDNIKSKLKIQKLILISTQVVEAGVDLDFDIGFREFSPFYSIIQTAGRINRENRSEVKKSAQLIITKQISFSPYHKTDLLEDLVSELITNPIRENCLLQILKNYFKIAIKRTSPDLLLINKMKKLEFENTIETFNDNFMKKLPYLIPVFIEIKTGLYDSFKDKLDRFYEHLKNNDMSLENKMEIKEKIKNSYKQVSLYVINVSKKDVDLLPPFYKDENMKLCSYDLLSSYYQEETGWTGNDDATLFF
ncbi:MAG: CRISPR-associated helicase Cas3' [Bacteroidota bacterium]|nr:CRISPR-associated helicase Cas3' [Bacteroidota bacterium]